VSACRRPPANRWRIARLVPRAGWTVVAAAVLVNVARGLLPVAFVVATSVMVAIGRCC
jgi:ATP-binding cassette subfamily B protein